MSLFKETCKITAVQLPPITEGSLTSFRYDVDRACSSKKEIEKFTVKQQPSEEFHLIVEITTKSKPDSMKELYKLMDSVWREIRYWRYNSYENLLTDNGIVLRFITAERCYVTGLIMISCPEYSSVLDDYKKNYRAASTLEIEL